MKTLLRIRLAQLLDSFTGKKKKTRVSQAGYLVLFAVLFLVYGASFYMNFFSFGDACAADGTGTLYFAFAGLNAFAISFLLTAFSAGQSLFDGRDNDLLLSMPVKPVHIVVSRMLVSLLLGFVVDLTVLIPAELVRLRYGFSAVQLIFWVIMTILISLFSFACSVLFGWLLSVLTRKSKKKDFIMSILSIIAVIVCFIGIQSVGRLSEYILLDSDGAERMFRKYLYVFYAFGKACSEADAFSALLVAALSVVLSAAVAFAVVKTFFRLATEKASAGGKKYTGGGIGFRS
nr:hypothetical protein [Clostridia bacterium]